MSDEWDKPVTKPLPGPVVSEAMQMTTAQRAEVVRAGKEAAHVAAGHAGPYKSCWCFSE